MKDLHPLGTPLTRAERRHARRHQRAAGIITLAALLGGTMLIVSAVLWFAP